MTVPDEIAARHVDVLVFGGGPADARTAALLARRRNSRDVAAVRAENVVVR